MKEIKPSQVTGSVIDKLLGIESSKIGYYGEVKQKIQELEAANLGLSIKKTELQAVFNSIVDAVVIYDTKGTVQHRNHVCPRLFPTETQLGNSCRALFHGEQVLASETCPVEQAIKGKTSQLSFTVLRDDQNRKRYYDAIATPIPTQTEDILRKNRALVFIRDVTDQRTRELQFLQAEKMSSIGLLAAGVAHEINNPLTSVAGYAEALQRRFREDISLAGDQRLIDFPRYLEVIVREVYRCKAITDSLQSFSRKSDGVFSEVDLNGIVDEVFELVRHTCRDKDITLVKEFSEKSPIVEGDSSAIRQIFLNLALNAIQSIDTSGTVKITSELVDSEICIRVIDDGSGIPAEQLDQIWTPFFTTKVVGKGQGLGLAVTYDIIEKHNGTIVVVSEVGVGTEFVVKFPRFRMADG